MTFEILGVLRDLLALSLITVSTYMAFIAPAYTNQDKLDHKLSAITLAIAALFFLVF